MTHDDLATLARGMIRVLVNSRQRITEHGESLLERDAVLGLICLGLPGVPDESDLHGGKAYHSSPDSPRCMGRDNTEITCEGPRRLAIAHLVRFISLFGGSLPHSCVSETSPRQPGPDCVNYLPTGRQYAQSGQGASFDHGVSIHKYLELAKAATNHLNISL